MPSEDGEAWERFSGEDIAVENVDKGRETKVLARYLDSIALLEYSPTEDKEILD